ncbi:class I SAM-dependent methyltransferase [Coleofasciculus sp.]|uniref:class I SAM-dependent methyltransferase n=1 Tax=Coleofasciculus sp. TaxID=3100458 RepID=UPI003A463194
MSTQVKQFYETYHDQITDKRFNSPYWLRRYAHRQIHAQFLPYLQPGQRVLDAGCGEGVLSCLAAQQGVDVVGIDISYPNIEAASRLAKLWNVTVEFLQADAEHLPFSDNSFDVVLSSHVLEHLPNLHQGLRELYRVTRNLALIAMPTCLNPACWVLLGGESYWKIGRRTPFALPVGLFKTAIAWVSGQEGPDQGYAGNKELPHIWRFPWVMRQQIKRAGFQIETFEAGPLIVPYLAQYISPLQGIQVSLDRYRDRPLLCNFGYGSMAVCRKPVSH